MSEKNRIEELEARLAAAEKVCEAVREEEVQKAIAELILEKKKHLGAVDPWEPLSEARQKKILALADWRLLKGEKDD